MVIGVGGGGCYRSGPNTSLYIGFSVSPDPLSLSAGPIHTLFQGFKNHISTQYSEGGRAYTVLILCHLPLIFHS